jgi:hypothetical protein
MSILIISNKANLPKTGRFDYKEMFYSDDEKPGL